MCRSWFNSFELTTAYGCCIETNFKIDAVCAQIYFLMGKAEDLSCFNSSLNFDLSQFANYVFDLLTS